MATILISSWSYATIATDVKIKNIPQNSSLSKMRKIKSDSKLTKIDIFSDQCQASQCHYRFFSF
jgi:hypothetical protein